MDQQTPKPLQKGDIVTFAGRNVMVKWTAEPLFAGADYRVGLAVARTGPLQFVWNWQCERVQDAKPAAPARAPTEAAASPAPAVAPYAGKVPKQAMPHQIDGIRWLGAAGGAILADQPGLGKTLTSIGALEAPAVVVCPAVMKAEWADEVAKWRPELTTAVVAGTKPLDASAYTSADVLIINYDIVNAHETALLDAHQQRPFRTIIADEAHNLKTLEVKQSRGKLLYSGSRRAETVALLCRAIPRRYLLSATPVLNRPIELFPLLHMVDPMTWSDYVEYGKRYCAGFLEQVVGYGGKRISAWNFDGASDVAHLHSRLSAYMLRRTKDILNLPPKTRQTIEVAMPKDIASEYMATANALSGWVDQMGGPAVVSKKKRAEQLAKLTALRGIAARGKVAAATRWILEQQDKQQGPLVVMAHHSATIDGLEQALLAARPALRIGRIVGGQSEKKRKADKEAFQAGKLDVILCSIMAAGVGLTLTRAAETLFVERSFRPMDLVQAEDRIHRIGQTRPCTITYMDARGTIDQLMAKILLKKTSTIAGVIEGEAIDEQEASRRVFGAMFGREQLDLPWNRPAIEP